jgi:toxin ParE1/3/4
MPLSIRRSRQAQLDLNEIWLAVAEDSMRAADHVNDRINQTIFMLANHPEAGRARDELRRGLRYFPVDSYLVFYTISAHGLEIRRVLHGARNIRAALFDD